MRSIARTDTRGLDAFDLTASEIAAGDKLDAPGKIAQLVRERDVQRSRGPAHYVRDPLSVAPP